MEQPSLEFILEKIYSRATQGFLKKEYPEFLSFLLENYSEKLSLSEKLFWYYHGLKNYPKCKTCGRPVRFNGLVKGYRDFCTLKCSRNNPSTIKKLKQTNLERYGVEYSSQNQEVKQKLKQTNLERYGHVCSLHNQYIQAKSKQTKLELYGDENYTNTNKMINTNLERYGVISTMQIDNVRKKAKQTKLELYGDENYTNRDKAKETNRKIYGGETPFHSSIIQKKSLDTKQNNFIAKNNDWLYGYKYDELNRLIYICKCPHPDCNKCEDKTFEICAQHYDIRRYNNIELCTKLLPLQYSKIKNTYIELFIKNILDEYNIKYECNTRNIIFPKELDIYIPSKQLAIECNGIYWHSADKVVKVYHFEKYLKCKENDIQLLTIWEDWIKNKPEIVKSIILAKLGIYDIKIYARNCEVRPINSKTSSDFLNKYHLQGCINSSVKLGLYYKDELISVMTFGKKRKIMNQNSSEGEFEMYRYCVKSYYNIIGGASKLLKYFIKKYSPNKIESYSSNDISNGGLYKILGFEQKTYSISYWFIENNLNRVHRFKYRKELPINVKKIYDSGVCKWVYDKQKEL